MEMQAQQNNIERDATATYQARLIQSSHNAEIVDRTTMGNGADLVKRIGAQIKSIEATRTSATKPINDGLKALNDHFKSFSEPLHQAKALVESKMNDYMREENRKAAEEQERLRKEQEEAALAEAARLEDAGDTAAAEEVLEEAAEAPQAIVPVTKQVHGDYGSTGFMKQGQWNYEIENLADVPLEYMMLDEKKVNAAIRRKDNPIREIPGLKIEQGEGKIQVR